MLDRYSYVRLMYTCLYEASMWGTTCFDPLFYHYPNDDNLYSDIEHTFIVGNGVKVSPVMSSIKGQTTFQSYFP